MLIQNVPWDDFARNWKKHKHFFLEIGQKSWKIPFESWFLADTEQTCVQVCVCVCVCVCEYRVVVSGRH